MDFKEHWRQRLLELFAASNMLQIEFAHLIEVEPSYLSRVLYPPNKKGKKSLGPVLIRKIADVFKLEPGWFDMPLGSAVPVVLPLSKPPAKYQHSRASVVVANEEARPTLLTPSPQRDWPFKRVSLQRLKSLKHDLGNQRGAEAIDDIDRTLEIMVIKWEQQVDPRKSEAV